VGSYEAAYDIWTEDNANEIMIWTDVHNVGPLGSNVGSLALDGRTYHVYKGTNGSMLFAGRAPVDAARERPGRA
jgi:hypothetical protein